MFVVRGTSRPFGRTAALAAVSLSALIAAAHPGLLSSPARAQAASPAAGMAEPGAGRMLVEADVVTYDLEAEVVTASGSVVIYYGAYSLLAGEVRVDRASKRVFATGNVELTDADGNVLRSESIELTDDLRDGVAEALELVTAQNTALAARRAERTDGDVTVFDDGVYLPCVDCNGVAGKKPIWQINAKRVIHRQGAKTITFEKANFEFLGTPIAWVPVLTQPDPSVRRKTGFLVPTPSFDSKRGAGLIAPYFYVLAPNMDVTVTPGYFSRQGPYLDVEYRHRIVEGDYSVRIAGLHQNDPKQFAGTSGDRDWRGGLVSKGQFTINPRWSWGWNVGVASDRSFFSDYPAGGQNSDTIVNRLTLSGVDGRNRFDANTYGFFVQQEDSRVVNAPAQLKDLQKKQPLVLPSADYQVYAPDGAVFGGEFSVNANLTAVAREKSDVFEYDNDRDGLFGAADGERKRLRAAAGGFTRSSVDALWRRRMVDNAGQVFTPFVYLRGDVFFSDPSTVSGMTAASDGAGLRGMPAAGLEYSFPILMQAAFGSQVIEPIAQLIVRPNEIEAGRLANEDAQSLVFDSTSLFDYDKFSGYDRVEGGTRLNAGLRYSGTFGSGFNASGSFGQSYLLFGNNSFSGRDDFLTGTQSGLDGRLSDFVAALNINNGSNLFTAASARFDNETFETNRLEAQVIGLSGPMTAAVTYAFIKARPDFGVIDDRSEIQGALSLRLDKNWRVYGSSRFDIIESELVRHAFGVAFDAEEFSLSLAYTEDRSSATSDPDRTLYLRLGFRTLGDVNASTSLD